MKFLKTVIFLLTTINCYSQNSNFRKAILKSDLIIVSTNFTYDTIRSNDFSKEIYLKVNKINRVLKNNLPITLDSLKATVLQDGEDFYSGIYDGSSGDCIEMIDVIEEYKIYYNVFFLKKENDTYIAYLIFKDIPSDQYINYTKQIETLSDIESISNTQQRFEKTLDWFINNGIMPDTDFIDFYKQEGLITNDIQYSDLQYQEALKLFKNGNKALLPMIRNKHFKEIKAHYVQIMEEISKKRDLDYSDFYNFSKSADAVTNDFNNEYESINTIIDDLLTNTCYSDYKKEAIMEHLLKIVKNWKDPNQE